MTNSYNYNNIDPYDVLYNPNHSPRKAKRANRLGLEDKDCDNDDTFIDWFEA